MTSESSSACRAAISALVCSTFATAVRPRRCTAAPLHPFHPKHAGRVFRLQMMLLFPECWCFDTILMLCSFGDSKQSSTVLRWLRGGPLENTAYVKLIHQNCGSLARAMLRIFCLLSHTLRVECKGQSRAHWLELHQFCMIVDCFQQPAKDRFFYGIS